MYDLKTSKTALKCIYYDKLYKNRTSQVNGSPSD